MSGLTLSACMTKSLASSSPSRTLKSSSTSLLLRASTFSLDSWKDKKTEQMSGRLNTKYNSNAIGDSNDCFQQIHTTLAQCLYKNCLENMQSGINLHVYKSSPFLSICRPNDCSLLFLHVLVLIIQCAAYLVHGKVQ